MSEGYTEPPRRSSGGSLLLFALLFVPFLVYEKRDALMREAERRGLFPATPNSHAAAARPAARLQPTAPFASAAKPPADSLRMLVRNLSGRPASREPVERTARDQEARPVPRPRLRGLALGGGGGVQSWFGGARHSEETTSAQYSAPQRAAPEPEGSEAADASPEPEARTEDSRERARASRRGRMGGRGQATPTEEEQAAAPRSARPSLASRRIVSVRREPAAGDNPCLVAAAPGVSMSEKTTHFTVEGSSLEELMESAKNRLPTPGLGPDTVGSTEHGVGQSCRYQEGQRGCRPICEVKVNAEKFIPRWNGSDPEVAPQWAQEQMQIQRHEDTHAMIALQQGNALKAALDAIPEGLCAEVDRAARRAQQEVHAAYKTRQAVFDSSGAQAACR